MRLSMMITSNKKNILLKHFFYSVKNVNIPKNIPSEIKSNIKTFYLEAGLYSQVLMIKRQTEVNAIKEGLSNKNDIYILPKK